MIVLGVIGVIFYLDLRGYLTGSERYRVEHIEVTGTNRTSEDRIIEYSRIRRENPIFSIGLRESAERIMEHPRVRDAAVAVTLPNRVSIHVVEREPVALVVFNKVYELDAERVILGEYKKGLSPKGPIISGVKKPDSLQDGVPLRDDGLEEALDLWREFDGVLSIEDMRMFGQWRPKPDARMLRGVLVRLRVPAHRCVLVEDTLAHQKSAHRVVGTHSHLLWIVVLTFLCGYILRDIHYNRARPTSSRNIKCLFDSRG